MSNDEGVGFGEEPQKQIPLDRANKLIEIAMVEGAITHEQGEAIIQLVQFYANMLNKRQVEIGDSPITNVGIVHAWRGQESDPYRPSEALEVLPMRLSSAVHSSEQFQAILKRLGEPPIYVVMYAGVGDDGVVDRAAILISYSSIGSAVVGRDELYGLSLGYHPSAYFPTHYTGIVFDMDLENVSGFRFSHTTSLKQNIPSRVFVMRHTGSGTFQGASNEVATVAPKHDGIIAWEAMFSGGVSG